MFPVKNGLNMMHNLFTGSYKISKNQYKKPIHHGLWEGFLKGILSNQNCTKFAKLMLFLDVQYHVSYAGSRKDF